MGFELPAVDPSGGHIKSQTALDSKVDKSYTAIRQMVGSTKPPWVQLMERHRHPAKHHTRWMDKNDDQYRLNHAEKGQGLSNDSPGSYRHVWWSKGDPI